MKKATTKSYITSLLVITFAFSTYAADTLTTSQILRDNGDTLISSRGRFELGFFTPNSSQNRYVGIWYKNIAERTVIWVANHEHPLTDTAGMLRVMESGVVVLLDANDTTIWSTNASRSVQTPVARLLDSGNLVVKDANDDDDDDKHLWQSFDYATDTFLPRMKLGRNFVTGKEVYLTSWKSVSDPAFGEYTFHLDPTGYPQFVMKRGDVVTYKSGPWNGMRFSGTPILLKNSIFMYGIVLNEKEAYYHFELINDSVVSRITMGESGTARRWIWVDRMQEWNSYSTLPLDNCDVYNGCGPYGSCTIKNPPPCGCLNKFEPKDPKGQETGDWTSGCIRTTPLDCRKGDGFVKYHGIKLPDTNNSWHNKSMTLEECKEACSKNCSCMAYTSLDISTGGSGCLLWFGDLVNIREMTPGQEIYIRMAHSELGSGGRKQEILTITLSLMGVIGIVLICLVLYSRKRSKLNYELPETDGSRLNRDDDHREEGCLNKDIELPLFDFATLLKATDGFSQSNKLGEGGFGPVYKARLEDGREVAVKRLSRTSHQGVDEFKNEMICIAELQHRNLVKLLGCCIQREEKMLVYEYMTNRSLDLILFDPVKSLLLDWTKRFNIINSIARGLMYLHQDSRLRVIHRDLKASNILLDSNMNPKISDFGLARTFGGDETGANTSRVMGTYGYMSPEYAAEGLFSVKSDVFSFGVLVLEIVSSKRNRGFYHRDHYVNLLGHAWMLYKEEKLPEFVDPCLKNSCDMSEVGRVIQIGLLCVQELPQDRPSMSSVVLMLSNGGALSEAKQPGFFTGKYLLKSETSVSSNASTATNTMTMSLPEGR